MGTKFSLYRVINQFLFKLKLEMNFVNQNNYRQLLVHCFITCQNSVVSPLVVYRATDKAHKSVITHWKSIKTHWKNKQCVKIRISISRYALGVKSSAYGLSKLTWKQNWCPFVCLSTHCQCFPSHYKFYYKNKCLQLMPQEVENRYQSYI